MFGRISLVTLAHCPCWLPPSIHSGSTQQISIKSSVPSPGQAPPELQTRRWRPSSRKITGTNVAVNCHRPLPSCGHSGRVPLYLTSPRISPCHTVPYRCRSILAPQLLASAASSSISKSTSSMGIACASRFLVAASFCQTTFGTVPGLPGESRQPAAAWEGSKESAPHVGPSSTRIGLILPRAGGMQQHDCRKVRPPHEPCHTTDCICTFSMICEMLKRQVVAVAVEPCFGWISGSFMILHIYTWALGSCPRK